MEVGQFYRDFVREGYKVAGPTAQAAVVELVESDPPQEKAEVTLKEFNDEFHGPGRYRPISFASASGTIDQDQATGQLVNALISTTTGWFDDYATDKFVTSDGQVIRWQLIKIYEDENDHSHFNGLWQYELRRIGSDQFHLLIKRIPVKK
jgi:hypothetical protein